MARSLPATRANTFRLQANKLFEEKKFTESIELYSAAIESDPTNPHYVCNRAHAHNHLENYGQALSDADEAIRLNPGYSKAYLRKAKALKGMGRMKDAVAIYQILCRSSPHNGALKLRMEECQKIMRTQAFTSAIGGPEIKLHSPFDDIEVDVEPDEDYTGPRWDEGEITLEFVEGMVTRFQEDKRLHNKYAYKILAANLGQMKAYPNVVPVTVTEGAHVTVCGDTHGQFYDLLHIFKVNGPPSPDNPYIFNGDFVDRGSWSLEVVMTLLAYKALYPDSVHLTRGNHETMAMNRMYGFEGEVASKHGRRMYECFCLLFCYLPLAFTINSKVFICHGGLFREDGITLADINAVDRVLEPPDQGIVCDILWSDPQDANGRAASKRGTGCMFGPDVTNKFLEDNNLTLLVRSHEMKEDGYDVQHGGKCITIFSAPNYCDQMGNLGAYIRFGADCLPRFFRFSASPHPAVAPMAYAPTGMAGLM